MNKYKIKVINGNKNINEIFVEILNKMICNNDKNMVTSLCTYKIPKIGGNNNKR